MGCAPYLQIFKGGQLVFTTAATLRYHQGDEELPFVQGIDGTVPFNVDQIIQGDILLRCRHLTFNKQRVSMFRSAFHTGYVPPNVMRLTKSQLDGACSDKRFPDDFFLDLIFEKVDPETATKLLENQQEEEEAEKELERQEDLFDTTGKNKKPVVKATAYDSMIQGDSRFWDIIANRRKEQVEQKKDDQMYGPTVGRRRGQSKRKKVSSEDANNGESKGPPKERSQLETFSIGNEFDFIPSEKKPTEDVPDKPKEKDSLMEALMALDEDEGEHALGTEEIAFGDTEEKKNTSGQDLFATSPAAAPESGGTASNGAETSPVASNEQVEPPSTEPAVPTSDGVEEETSTKPTEGDISDLLDTASDDMDALLASAGEDLGDLDLGDFDDDDDLEDLEKLLAT